MLTENNYTGALKNEIHLFDSFFTAVECSVIISELRETAPLSLLPACFGNNISREPGKMEQLPWTDLLLSIKQFVEDRLELDLNTGWLCSDLSRKKFSLLQDIENNKYLFCQPLVLIYFGNEAAQNGSLIFMNEGLNVNTLQSFYKRRTTPGPEFVLLFWKKR